MVLEKSKLIRRAENLIEKGRGILYKSSIGILKSGLKNAKKEDNYEDLEEFVPIIERQYERLKRGIEEDHKKKENGRIRDIILFFSDYTIQDLEKELSRLEKESLSLMKKWSNRRPDERTQRKAYISNRADAVARRKLLVQDAIENFHIIKDKSPF